MLCDPDDVHEEMDDTTYWAHEQAYWDALRDAHEAKMKRKQETAQDPDVDPNFVPTLQPPPGVHYPWNYEELTVEETASRLAFLETKTTSDVETAVEQANYQKAYDHYFSILRQRKPHG